MSDYLSTHEAAKRLGVSAKTVARWVDAGQLQAVFTSGGHRRIPVEDVEQFVSSRRSLQARQTTRRFEVRVVLMTSDLVVASVVGDAIRRAAGLVGIIRAGDAFSAGLALGNQSPQLVFLDADLPGSDLLETCRQIMGRAEELKSVALVVLADRLDASTQAQLAEMDIHYIPGKPPARRAIERLMRSIIVKIRQRGA